MSKKVAVYTAIFGKYDTLKDKVPFSPTCDYVCFTDNRELKSDVFQMKYYDVPNLDKKRSAGLFKMLPNIFLWEYDITIWIDGSVLIKKDPVKFAKTHLESNDFVVYKHPERNSVFEEANECIFLTKGKYEIILRQVDYYRKEGFPDDLPLTENAVIFRNNHNKDVVRLNEEWWKQISAYSKRDQLSLNYVIWKNNINIGIIDDTVRNNEYFEVVKHGI